MEFIKRTKERQEIADHMRARGYEILVKSDLSKRPALPTWYGARVNGRLTVAALTRRQGRTGGPDSSRTNVMVIAIMVAAQVDTPFDYGVHTKFGRLAAPTVEENFPPRLPGSKFPIGVREAFLAFARGLIPPGQPDHRRYHRHTRIVDTQKIADWLPPGIFQGTSVLTIHDLPLDNGWQHKFDNAVNGLGWIAHAIEQAALDELQPRPTGP